MDGRVLDEVPDQQRAARLVAGWALLAMAGLGMFASLGVLQGLVVDGDPVATAEAAAGSPGVLRAAALAFLAVAVLDVVVAVALHRLLAPSAPLLSATAAALRIAYAAVLAGAVGHLATASSGAESSTVGALEAFETTWALGLGVFGVHLLLLGAAFTRWPEAPRLLGPLLVLAGAGYLVDSVGGVLHPGATWTVAAFAFIGEVVLLGWLLLGARRGRRATPAVARATSPEVAGAR